MNASTLFTTLAGNWRGTYRLWLSPEEPAHVSESSATIALAARGEFATLRYTWSYKNQIEEGLILLTQTPADQRLRAVWIDSWHMSGKFMHCEGVVMSDSPVCVRGRYAAPPGPDWDWKIPIEPLKHGEMFRIVMHNISPEGQEMLAVEDTYTFAGRMAQRRRGHQ